MKTPILFLIFSRIDTTTRVFEAIRAARPERLYVAADGPRASRGEAESEKCRQTRAVVMDHIDWPCEVKTLFRDENLGCGRAVSEALQWFFDQEPEGIVLEDDCLPNPDFFVFCQDMLERYRDNPEVVSIGGYSFVAEPTSDDSYYFSAYNFIWGWAAWRRVMDGYNHTLEGVGLCRYAKALRGYGLSWEERLFLIHNFLLMKTVRIDTWDYQHAIGLHLKNVLSIIPNKTLIQNIGFGEGATHTSGEIDPLVLRPAEAIMPLKHPLAVVRDAKADKKYIAQVQYKSWMLRSCVRLYVNYILGKKG